MTRRPSPSSLSEEEVGKLLDKLCVRLGFRLVPEHQRRLAADPPKTVPEFVDEVFRAEGLDPATADRRLWRDVRDVVSEAFQSADG